MSSGNGSGRSIRILLVDDHLVMREGTRRILEEQSDFRVVAETEDGNAAVQLAAELEPDVVLMDIRIKGINGIEATREIIARCPSTRIVALTAYDFDQYVKAMIQAGAVGYLLKSASGREVVDAVRAASEGNLVVSADVAHRLVGPVPSVAPTEVLTGSYLSARELLILSLLSEGKRNNQIAEELGIQPKTVEFHLTNLYAKLDVNSRLEAITRAKELGLEAPLVP